MIGTRGGTAMQRAVEEEEKGANGGQPQPPLDHKKDKKLPHSSLIHYRGQSVFYLASKCQSTAFY